MTKKYDWEYKKGTQLLVAPYSDEFVEDAKLYITDNGYNSETVKMFKGSDGFLLVIKL